MNTRGLYWLPVLVWMSAILALSSIPSRRMPPWPVPHGDKIAHAAAYVVGGWLTSRAARTAAAALAIPCAFGVFDEWRQRTVPGRDCDFADWLADCLGVFLGVAIARARKPPG